jgi:hypothetical protein
MPQRLDLGSLSLKEDHMSGDHFIRTAGEDIYLHGATLADQDFVASARQDIPMLIRE